ncbi:MAG: alpha-1,4-glucan--maltose-1-phosphate maltosyltransferase [Solirubrobacteraceae bacterium]
MPTRTRTQPPQRITVRAPEPSVDCGRHPAKRCVGDRVNVQAEIFADGHEALRAVVRWKAPGARRWSESPLRPVDAHIDGDTWAGEFDVDRCGRWTWTVQAWIDSVASWREELRRKLAADQRELGSELAEGAMLLERRAGHANARDAELLRAAAAGLPRDPELAFGEDLVAAAERAGAQERPQPGALADVQVLEVDRLRARFGAWYELFPRSWGGLEGTARAVPEIAALGFDVLYLTPIHPIGETNRKGANNALVAAPGDPGSPWAIGSRDGGHEAIDPSIGGEREFAGLLASCQEHGMELALDLAFQCSADHPWLSEHPEWFHRRPDGTLKYAENPPKKYQDIYNMDFACADWQALWQALLEVTLGWVERGVKIFRVDNPHTKPLAFWEWMIAAVRAEHPDVLFLAEAFTRRAVMRALAKIGFNQSYTYFTWKNGRHELTEYVNELAYETADYFRPNFFANTPDILHAYLQHGGRPAFEARLVLAATLSPTYGIYSGFEACENVAVREGSEEYLDSEKYGLRERTLKGPLLPLIKAVNEARVEHAALQRLDNIVFLETHNEALISYLKRTAEDIVLVVVSLDPAGSQEGLIEVGHDSGLPPVFRVEDLLDGARYDWRLGGNYVRMKPGERQAHLFAVSRP